MDNADYGAYLVYNPHIWWDPIGPWVVNALDQETIDKAQANQLTVRQVELQKRAAGLQRQLLELQEEALDAIAESVDNTRRT